MTIVASKVRLPTPRNDILHRPRLDARLGGPLPRLLLFCAPAGFGKTTLALDWLRGRGSPVAWLGLDSHDNDPTRFVAHLAAALRTLDPDAPDPGATSGGHDESALPKLLARLTARGARGTVVLDDYHNIESPAVHATVRALLDGLGPGLHLLLLTRVDPPLPLGRMRVSGELLELRERDLRFTRDETDAFFRLTLADPLPERLVGILDGRTEGWAAGLRMATLALQGASDREAVVSSFSGDHHFVMDYLLEEALARQPDEIARFLMDTSILARFDEDLCAAVTEEPRAGLLLEAVETANLFLVPLDGEHRWFRYHHLFAELSEHRLRRLHPERVEGLHRRASAWLEARGDVQEALRHASRMAAREPFLEMLDRQALGMITRSELATFGRWIREVPDPESLRYPMLLASLAWFRLLTDRRPVLESLLAAAGAALDDPAVPYTAKGEGEVRQLLQALRAYHLRFAGRPAEAIRASEAVLASLGDGHRLVRGAMLFNQARAHMQLGEMPPAEPLLRRAWEENLAGGNSYLMLASFGHLGAVLLQTEGVSRAREVLEAALAMARERDLESLPACGIVLYHLGRLHYLADEPERAREVLERAVELGREGHEPEVLLNGLVQLARVHAAAGEWDAARALHVLAELIGEAHNATPFDTTLAVERVRLARASGDRSAAPFSAELSADGAHAGLRWSAAWESEAVLALETGLARGDVLGAGMIAARLREAAEARGRGLACCAAAIAEACVHPRGPGQWECLDRALEWSARRGYLRPWLDGGAPVRALLRASVEHALTPESAAFARRLLARQPGEGEEQPAIPKFRQPLPSPLTEREQEVLHHLAQGKSNKGIARAMLVSSETVKTHLKHIFAKLGASTRAEARDHAEALGLVRVAERL
jgi:LuxR family transcriptional regulator, maltose regulon positive regulatory protein